MTNFEGQLASSFQNDRIRFRPVWLEVHAVSRLVGSLNPPVRIPHLTVLRVVENDDLSRDAFFGEPSEPLNKSPVGTNRRDGPANNNN